jgi:fatty acid desaturase
LKRFVRLKGRKPSDPHFEKDDQRVSYCAAQPRNQRLPNLTWQLLWFHGVLMLRYFEYDGSVRRALSVVKKRSGNHEHTIREFKLSHQGITVGPPLKGFSGIFTGTPVYKGEEAPLMSRDTNGRG